MSRTSIRTFLITAKRHLQHQLHHNGTGTASFVIGNESADLDSIASALVYGYIESSKSQAKRHNQVTIPILNIPAADLSLRPELTTLLRHADCKPSDLITLDDLGNLPLPLNHTTWTLVDHNALTGPLSTHYSESVTGVIDHHDDENAIPTSASPRIISKSGSCTSLVTNHLRPAWDDLTSLSTSIGAANGQSSEGVADDFAYTSNWDAQVAKLALGAFLIDTQNLTDESKVTEHDRKAVRYLEARVNVSMKYGKDYDRLRFFDEISEAKASLDGLALDDVLRKDYKQWTEGSLTVGISSVVKPLSYLVSKVGSDEAFVEGIKSFAQSRSLDLYAIMTAYTDDSDHFTRQLLLVTLSDAARGAAERFVGGTKEELQLWEDESESESKLRNLSVGEVSEGITVQLWEQGNVGASRKRVGPLLREAMR